jgi:peptidase E
MAVEIKDEWTQEEFLKAKKELQKQGVEVLLVDTILNPIEKTKTITYNPFELQKYPHGSVFVFYCDTGKDTKERLAEFKKKFPNHHCVSLRGGRGYWRKNMQVLDD